MNTGEYKRPLTEAERAWALAYLDGHPDAQFDWSMHRERLGVPRKPLTWWERFLRAL